MNVASTAPAGNANSARTADNPQGLGKEDFLKLLITQISSQNPLEPMKGADFVAQLATFANLEQLTQANQGLNLLALGQAGILTSQSVSMVGKTVVYPSDKVQLDGAGEGKLRYELPSDAAKVEVVIRNEAGTEVATLQAEAGAGPHDLSWDGTNAAGDDLPPGTYTFEVRATDAEGAEIAARTYGVGRVRGVSFEKGYAEVLVGDERIQTGDLVEVLETD